ncbi:flagellar hook-length control protein FliK [Acetivibrio cellulolyticus]|uniref:flagellar hook-length control protein FliK n=1 Tax=Acetivibrio cellulolyticus TaxID=35830 RepID=UPI0001E2C249|nr:flagellar hook-length control protein FliK [Acetivibrio cellulolyticus]
MVTKSFIVDFLGKSASPLTEIKKKESINSASYPNFIDTLNSTVEKNFVSKSDPSVQRNTGISSDKKIDKRSTKGNEVNAKADASESNSKIKSYKDAVKENEQVSARKEVKSSDGKSADNNEHVAKKGEKKTETVEQTVIEESLAQILNISVEELKKVMSALNISSEELVDESKTAEIAGKISDLFGLSSDQKATLIKIAEFTVNESKSMVNEMKTQDNEQVKDSNKEGWVKLEGVDVEVVETDKKVQLNDVEALGNKLKKVLNELENKLQNEPEKLFEGISDKVEEIAVNDVTSITAKGTTETKTVEDVNFTPSEEKKDDKVAKTSEESGKPQEKEADTSSDQKAERIELRKAETDNTIELNTEDANNTQFGNVLNNQQIKTNGASEVSKLQNEVAVSKKEIVSQIVEKAKVILTDEKSEMVIDLKPDHLGKLSLKVVTERGAVVAKFVAESEQVKAAIESNMDNLKESLTKQGFSIQGFSVSVGQDSKKGFAEGYEFSKNSNRAGKGEKVAATGMVGVSAIEENQQKLNPYMLNNSSIDLTA